MPLIQIHNGFSVIETAIMNGEKKMFISVRNVIDKDSEIVPAATITITEFEKKKKMGSFVPKHVLIDITRKDMKEEK
jgi:hypothetical protein